MRRFLQLHFGCLLLLLLAVSHDGAAQGRRISTFPYNQSFGFVTAGVTQFPTTDVDGGEFVADDSTATTWTTTLSAAGLYNAGGKLRIQTVKANQQQGFVWHGDFSNANADSISIGWNKVVNGSVGTRTSELRIATNGGSGGTFTDVPGITWPTFDNSITSQAGILKIKLPSSLHGSSDPRIRIYVYHGGSGSGNQPRLEVDDLKITTTCLGPAAAAFDSAGALGTQNLWLYFKAGLRTDSMLVIKRQGTSAPTALPADGTRYAAGQGLNGTDTVAFWGPASKARIYVAGLKDSTTYRFTIYGWRECSATYSVGDTIAATTLSGCTGTPDKITNITAPHVDSTTVRFDFTTGTRTDTVLIIRRKNAPPGLGPSPNKRYFVGQIIGLDNIVVYFGPPTTPVTVIGQQSDSTYVYSFYGFQSCNATYNGIGSLDTVRMRCTGRPLNVSSLSSRYKSSNSVGLQISLTGFADHYVVFRDGGNGLPPTLTNGTEYPVGAIVGDDTVKYYGTSRRPAITGLPPATAVKFYAYGVRQCNYTYSATGGTVADTTKAACASTPDLLNVQGLEIVKNVTDTLQLRWRKLSGVDSFVVVARIDSTPGYAPRNGWLYGKTDEFGGAYVLATVPATDTQATILRLPSNTAYFLQIYGMRACDLGYSFSSATLAFATPGTQVSQRFAVRAKTLPSLNFGYATITFTKAPLADGSLLITRRSGPPGPGTRGLPFFRAGKSPVNVVSDYRWWSFNRVGLDSFLYDMRLDISGIPGVKDPNDLEILYRPHPDSVWLDIVTSAREIGDSTLVLRSNNRYFFSDYAIGANSKNNVLPVKLISFTGYARPGQATLRWRTAGELNTLGFRVHRARVGANGNAANEALVADYMTDNRLRSLGNTNAEREYALLDSDDALFTPGNYRYRLEEVTVDGTIEDVGEVMVEVREGAIGTLRLAPITPNPTNGAITLRFALPEPSNVRAALYDLTGRQVRTLVAEEQMGEGMHTVAVVADGLPAGTYYCRLVCNGQTRIQPVVVTR
ncbi:MAG: T9SS type A sorting domain-containing protein [Chlorobi bacterium]|nr:MAG: Bacillopeptidase F [Chlorobi bacterium OLB7]MBK8911028.1 T9SS type A sorting domain-containing protein [Chlorobiota bacterium]